MSPLVASTSHAALACAGIIAGWLWLWHAAPAAPEIVYALLAHHPWLTGTWLALGIIGADYSLVALRDTVSYRAVGAKASAHWHQREGRQ